MQDEQEIIEKVLQGDKQAFGENIDRYKVRVLSLRKMLGHSADGYRPGDFYKMYSNLQEYKPGRSFSAWLYRIAANRFIDELRKRKRTPSTSGKKYSQNGKGFSDYDVIADEQTKRKYCAVTFLDGRTKGMQEDWELIKQLREGNNQAFTEIVNRYKGKIYAFLYRMIGHSQDAQDLAQEVFIKAYCKIEDYRPDNSFSSWLYRIAANHCLDAIRKRKRTPAATGSEAGLIHGNTPERLLLVKERNTVLHEHLLALEEEYRVVLLLRHVEHLSYKEIGEVLSLPVTTVQMRLHRAHKKLRKCLTLVKGGGPFEMYEV